MRRCFVFAGIAWAVFAAMPAARAAARRSVVLEVAVAGRPAWDWRAEALTRTLTADLADDRLAPRPPPACSGPCSDAALRAAGVELVVRATLTEVPASVGYELRALWPGGPGPVRGALALGRLGRVELSGALRDPLHRMARATGEDAGPDREGDAAAAAAVHELPPPGDVAVAIGLALAVLAAPIALGSLRARRLVARAAALRALIGVGCAGGLALAIAALEPPGGRGALFAAGGVAWGALAAVTLPVVLPPLPGLQRSDYRELLRLLAGWSGLVVRRAAGVALIYAPVALGVVLAGDAIVATDGDMRLALVMPLALLVVRQAVRLAVAVVAERLDAALVDPTVDATAWRDAVRGYLVGYLRRNGLPVDTDQLDRLVVIPSRPAGPAAGDEVRVYGGGATHTRVAIPRRMLELALAPWGRPHDYAAPRVSTLHWTQWNAGLVMATEPGAVVATREQRQPRETTAEGDPSEHAREDLGEPPTLIGIIEPRALDPRTSYRPHDDPAWLDWEPLEDYDGTDAGDRDFLFGVLAHAIAQAQRHGDRIATLAAWLRPLGRLLDRLSDPIADDHAAISGARHHLVQYLGWEAWQREDLLTRRAYAPELEAMSRRLLAMTNEPRDATRGGVNGPALPVQRGREGPLLIDPVSRTAAVAARARTRLARLAGLVPGTVAVPSGWRRLALAGAVAAGLGAAAFAVVDAARYHASYHPQRPSAQAPPKPTEKSAHGQD
ncbi:MAG TPA: hypothetical protein VHW23_26175 [Kofleriaceae bacterium]|nr:hypothetical protein [Kofleriaceae bacterium]